MVLYSTHARQSQWWQIAHRDRGVYQGFLVVAAEAQNRIPGDTNSGGHLT